jgi:nucleoside diphosphate kinase
MKQYSLFWVKPDVFYDRDLPREAWSELKIDLPSPEDFIDEIKSSLIARWLKIETEKRLILSQDIAREHYAEHSWVYDIKSRLSKQDFLVEFMTSWLSHWIVFSWYDAIKIGREILKEIRTKYLVDTWSARYNMTHASDSIESATKEIRLHFPEFIFNK